MTVRPPNPMAMTDESRTSTDVGAAESTNFSRARGQTRRVAPPNQFQKFVQETTGRLLPVFGSDLFEAPQSYLTDSALPAPDDYVLGPGDEVRVRVWGVMDYSASHTIDRDGQITLPRVGAFSLAGVPVRDVNAVLKGHLGKVFTNFSVNATLGRLRSVQVYVVGQARQPGAHLLPGLSTLINAVFASGGPTANGSMRNVQLSRGKQIVATLDLYDFIAKGNKGQDTLLQPGDVIVIPPVGPRIAIAGAFDQAAIYELKSSGGTVGDTLALTGGVPALAKTNKAIVERIDVNKTPQRQVIDITLDNSGLAQKLQDGDVLTLLPISPAFANAVTLQGLVAEPLRYPWFEGMRVLDLIPNREALVTSDYYKRKNLLVQNEVVSRIEPLTRDAAKDMNARDAGGKDSIGKDQNVREGAIRDPFGKDVSSKEAGSKVVSRVRGMQDQINWEYAVVERMDKSRLSTELLPFNLGKAVLEHDPQHNIALLPGDVVTILSHSDLRLPQDRQTRLVRVEGEVAAPGIYPALPGETLPQLLKRVGGLTPQAYVFGIEFNRESVRQRQQDNLESLIRRLEAQAQSQATSAAANSKSDAAQAQLLQMQQQAQVKGQIDRLRTLKSNGRMALELDPLAQSLAALPALTLEDGDRIMVPSVPGFVAAFGSVNNENVFIYRPGKTVADVIKSAGQTEDAEPDQAFVLRADGSIVAKRDNSSYFGGGFDSMLVMPGDTVVIPAQMERESRYNFIVRSFKDWTQILANLGLGAAAIKTLRN